MELKPCPFCGRDDHLEVVPGGLSFVTCNACEACGPDAETGDEARRLWNVRHEERGEEANDG